MKCLVTGASGFLGRAVAQRLAGTHAVTRQSFRTETPSCIRVDLRDPEQLRTLLGSVAPDIVVHAAAYRDPDFCEQHPEETRRLNVTPIQTMARELPPTTKLIFISSDYVFDGEAPPYAECSPRRAISAYGQSKIEGEDMALTHPSAVVLRIPLLIGAGPSLETSGFIGQLVHTVRDKTPCRQDHVLRRYPTWIRDVAEAVAFLAEGHASGPYHLSGPAPLTRYETARRTAAILNETDAHISPSDAIIPRVAPRPRDSALSTERLRALGFNRSTDFDTVLRRTLDELHLEHR